MEKRKIAYGDREAENENTRDVGRSTQTKTVRDTPAQREGGVCVCCVRDMKTTHRGSFTTPTAVTRALATITTRTPAPTGWVGKGLGRAGPGLLQLLCLCGAHPGACTRCCTQTTATASTRLCWHIVSAAHAADTAVHTHTHTHTWPRWYAPVSPVKRRGLLWPSAEFLVAPATSRTPCLMSWTTPASCFIAGRMGGAG